MKRFGPVLLTSLSLLLAAACGADTESTSGASGGTNSGTDGGGAGSSGGDGSTSSGGDMDGDLLGSGGGSTTEDTGCKKVDFLFVVDNSVSMSDHDSRQ